MVTETLAPPRRRLRVWREVVYIVLVYSIYSFVRNRFGSAGGEPGHAAGIAYGHALDVIDIERGVKLFFEERLQSWYLGLPGQGFVQFWNVFYGTGHFVVTMGALAWLFFRDPARYPRLRNILACTTVAGLIGFASFSLMPPRLLNETPDRYGPPAGVEHEFRFVDTLAKYPTFWSFDDGGLKKLSNQYAAMPSLHVAWAVWSAIVLWPMLRRRWAKTLVLLHPMATVFCITVTANHYWLDAAAGLLTLGVGVVAGTQLTALWDRRNAPVPRDIRPGPEVDLRRAT